MKILNKIDNCLNNECGGPNLENMISIGVAIGISLAVLKLGQALWGFIHGIPRKRGGNDGSIIWGWQPTPR